VESAFVPMDVGHVFDDGHPVAGHIQEFAAAT
jgi:hypothetical protein